MEVLLVFGFPLTYILISPGWLKDQSDAPSFQSFQKGISILHYYTLTVLKQLKHFNFFTFLNI